MSDATHPGAARYNRDVDEFGALDGTGGECDYSRECDAASVYALVWPASDGVPVYCCPYHVGLYAEDHPDRFRRFVDHDDLEDPRRYRRDDRFYRLDEVPPKVRNGEFQRIGLDHHGEAHFGRVDDDGRATYLRLDRSLDLVAVDSYPRDEVELGDWLDHVADRRGWVAVDDDLVEQGREVGRHE